MQENKEEEKRKGPFDWDLETNEKKLSNEQLKEMALLSDAFWVCFGTPQGKKVLEHLRKKFDEPMETLPEWGSEGMYQAYTRGGQRRVYKFINQQIEKSIRRRKQDDNADK